MIRNTFIFLDKIGEAKEKQLWQQGVREWNDFLEKEITCVKKEKHEAQIKEAKTRLFLDDAEYFAKILPQKYHWRLWEHYKDEACFLDIETCGNLLTTIGMFNGTETKTMMFPNINKDALIKELEKYKIIVTYNGASFDIPFLEKYFGWKNQLPHIDLRGVCSKTGLTGGLKEIEKQLQIKRAKEVDGMTGMQAAALWEAYRKTGNKDYANLIVQYNEEDCINLKSIARTIIPQLWQKQYTYQ